LVSIKSQAPISHHRASSSRTRVVSGLYFKLSVMASYHVHFGQLLCINRRIYPMSNSFSTIQPKISYIWHIDTIIYTRIKNGLKIEVIGIIKYQSKDTVYAVILSYVSQNLIWATTRDPLLLQVIMCCLFDLNHPHKMTQLDSFLHIILILK